MQRTARQAVRRIQRTANYFIGVDSMTEKTDAKGTTEAEAANTAGDDVLDDGGILLRMTQPRYRGEQRISSMDLDEPETKLRLFNAGAAKSTPMGEMLGKPFKPLEYMAERVVLKSKDKPDRKGCRLTIWIAGGEMLFTTSESIVTAFDRLIGIFGDDLKSIPQWVQLGSVNTAGGNRWYTVELVDAPSETKTKKK